MDTSPKKREDFVSATPMATNPTSPLFQTPNTAGSSSFKNTVSLYEWWLVKKETDFNGKRLAVEGMTSRGQQAVRVFCSAPIIKRHSAFTLETADGITVLIRGLINRSRTHKNGFPSEVCNHFLTGFPYSWEVYADKYMGKECATKSATSDFSSFDKLSSPPANNASSDLPICLDEHPVPRVIDFLKFSHGSSGGDVVRKGIFDDILKNCGGSSVENIFGDILKNYSGSSVKSHTVATESDVKTKGSPEKGIHRAEEESDVKTKCSPAKVINRAEEESDVKTKCSPAKVIHRAEEESDVKTKGSPAKGIHRAEEIPSKYETTKTIQTHENCKASDAYIESNLCDNMVSCGENVGGTVSHVKEEPSGCNSSNPVYVGLEGIAKEYVLSEPNGEHLEMSEKIGNCNYNAVDDLTLKTGFDMKCSTPVGGGMDMRNEPPSKYCLRSTRSRLKNLKSLQEENHTPNSGMRNDGDKRASTSVAFDFVSDGINPIEKLSVSSSSNAIKSANGEPGNEFFNIEFSTYKSGDSNASKVCKVSTRSGAKNATLSEGGMGMSKEISSKSKTRISSISSKNLKNNGQTAEITSGIEKNDVNSMSVDCDFVKPESLGMAGKKIRRKSECFPHANQPLITRDRAKKLGLVSPESLNCKRSKSGRLVVPRLDYWRNQQIIYDADGKITGIQDDPNTLELRTGSRSDPPRKREKH